MPSIFDTIEKEDIVMAFFPCVRFETQILLSFRGDSFQMKCWEDTKKMEYCMKLQQELSELYELINMLFILCIRKEIKLIVENPYQEDHYLKRYWCMKPSLIDTDRRERGDYFKKPTQYWFINCEPKDNFIFEPRAINSAPIKDAISRLNNEDIKECLGVNANRKVARSMIHPDYANRFIREFILPEEKE